MTSLERLSLRQKRILNEVLQELECVISVPNARLMLEANDIGSIMLSNHELQPVAFAIRYATWSTYVYGVTGEIFAWILFIPSGLLILLVIISTIALALVSLFTLKFELFLKLLQIIPALWGELEQIAYRFTHNRWVAGRRRYNAYKKLCVDKRAPILYLRSFSFDPVYELPLEDQRKADERLAEYYEQYGPVIAVAGPDDKGPMLGPVRLYFNDDVWRAGVIYLMSISQFVVIQAGISQGTLWELGIARRILEPEKLIISIVDASNPDVADSYYYDFRPYAEVILGCELPRELDSSLCIGFGKNWEPLLQDSYGGLPFTVAEGQRRNQTYNDILAIKASTTKLYESTYKECLYCGLYNWHEETICEFCRKILKRD
jgi:hypothetical protein